MSPGADSAPAGDDAVLARTRSWLEKAVIGLNLCPFAKAVYTRDQVRLVLSRARHIDDLLEELDRELELLVATPAEQIDTTLVVHPTLFPDFLDFNDFLEIAEGVLAENGLEGVIQIASFHPNFQFEGTEPEDMGNYTNRSPYPTLHLLREDSVERAVASMADPDVIYRDNIRKLEDLGLQGWRQLQI